MLSKKLVIVFLLLNSFLSLKCMESSDSKNLNSNKSWAIAKMVAGGLGMGISALVMINPGGTDCRSPYLDPWETDSDILKNYFRPNNVCSSAFILTRSVGPLFFFPHFLDMFKSGLYEFNTKENADTIKKNDLKNKILNIYSIAIGSLGCFVGGAYTLGSVLQFFGMTDKYRSRYDSPCSSGSQAFFSVNLAVASANLSATSYKKIKNLTIESKQNSIVSPKNNKKKLWALCEIIAGGVGVLYGIDGMVQSLSDPAYQKQSLIPCINALGMTTAYTFVAIDLVKKGWSNL